MPRAARKGDAISGLTSGEHSGHIRPTCSPSAITGNIGDNCSSNVFINGVPAAFVGSVTNEYDSCCGGSKGKIASGSSKVFINGRPAAREGDNIDAHNGTASVSSGSNNVFIE